jgi:hypothetical protein
MLETLVKDSGLSNEVSVRAATFLARDHGRDDLAAALHQVATSGKEELRGVATAALAELGDATMMSEARRLSSLLLDSRSLVNVGWGVLVRAAAARALSAPSQKSEGLLQDGVASETAFRWLQWGWLE